jgi:hypothetical protein
MPRWLNAEVAKQMTNTLFLAFSFLAVNPAASAQAIAVRSGWNRRGVQEVDPPYFTS